MDIADGDTALDVIHANINLDWISGLHDPSILSPQSPSVVTSSPVEETAGKSLADGSSNMPSFDLDQWRTGLPLLEPTDGLNSFGTNGGQASLLPSGASDNLRAKQRAHHRREGSSSTTSNTYRTSLTRDSTRLPASSRVKTNQKDCDCLQNIVLYIHRLEL
jgi:hypothetical protein